MFDAIAVAAREPAIKDSAVRHSPRRRGYRGGRVACSRTRESDIARALLDDFRLALELLDERRFGNGIVHLRYRARA